MLKVLTNWQIWKLVLIWKPFCSLIRHNKWGQTYNRLRHRKTPPKLIIKAPKEVFIAKEVVQRPWALVVSKVSQEDKDHTISTDSRSGGRRT
jgi:hypothetical protein